MKTPLFTRAYGEHESKQLDVVRDRINGLDLQQIMAKNNISRATVYRYLARFKKG